MDLGVNTHFDQGWPLSTFGQIAESRAAGFRDTVSWGKVERSPGRHDFNPANSGYVDRACAQKLPVLLTLTPRNPVYDGGETVYSEQGRQAFGRFALAVLDRFPCVTAIEIGNEINGHSLKGRVTDAMPQSYIAILDAVRSAIAGRHPDVALLSGSSLGVATGFFEKLIGAGLLSRVSGLVVHPYLNVPELLPQQIARLRAAMVRAGQVRPLWASEFGFTYDTLDAAPPHALKMITLLSAAGVKRADWYALREEKWYPHMGLYAADGHAQPALATFRLAAERLLPKGDAKRMETDDPLSHIYRFGDDLYVAWGQGRGIRFRGATRAWNARGQPVPVPVTLADAPVVVQAAGVALGPVVVHDDSLTNFAGSAWSYGVVRAGGERQPLDWVDWNWTSYLGVRAMPNFRAMANIVSLGHPSDDPPRLVERYLAPVGGNFAVSACFEGQAASPVAVTIHGGDRLLWSGTVASVQRLPALPVALRAGEAVSIGYRAQGAAPLQVLRRRIRILAGGEAGEALCAPAGKDSGAGEERP